MKSRRAQYLALCGVVATCAMAASSIAMAGEVTLKSAWLRPAAVGMSEAQAYVDISSDADLVLVGASTPFAKKVELVLVSNKSDPPELKVVPAIEVPAGVTTRLAYRGSHLRLVEITKDFGNGTSVPLTRAFRSPEGRELTATIDAQVRGLLLPQQMPMPARKTLAPPEAK